MDSSRSSAMRTPAAAQVSTICRCQPLPSPPNHSVTASAMVGPTPSTAANSSVEAARMASMVAKCPARARAAVGPTCRIDRATSTRHKGCSLTCCRLSSRRTPTADSTRPSTTPPGGRMPSGSPSSAAAASAFLAARVYRLVRSRSSAVRSKTPASSVSTPASSRAPAPSHPRDSMSKAPRPASPKSRSRSCAGHDRLLGQRMSLSPSFAGASSVPQEGQWVGMTNAVSLPSRRSATGPRISGMTSPALRTTTVSPIRTPLRSTS